MKKTIPTLIIATALLLISAGASAANPCVELADGLREFWDNMKSEREELTALYEDANEAHLNIIQAETELLRLRIEATLATDPGERYQLNDQANYLERALLNLRKVASLKLAQAEAKQVGVEELEGELKYELKSYRASCSGSGGSDSKTDGK